MHRSTLETPEGAEFAWGRFRRIMRGWSWASLVCVIAVEAWLWPTFGLSSLHVYLASAVGTVGIVMMVGALMGLVFLSSGTGHDEAVIDSTEIEKRR
jgi:hypothetical protein